MPILKFRLPRGLALVGGITRSGVSELDRGEVLARELRRARKRMRRQRRRIRRLQRSRRAFTPNNMVWILGTARTGSTWLGAMMSTLEGQWWWQEPGLGELVGISLPRLCEPFTFKSRYKENWLRRIRPLVVGGANARFGRPSKSANKEPDYLVIQEPNGSVGAPWLLEAVPESRMIFLVRDPRDVVASQLDAYQKGSWAYTNHPIGRDSKGRPQEVPLSLAETDPNAFVERVANRYLRDIGCVKRAYDLHEGPKVLVRYEELRANTVAAMSRMYSALKIQVDEEELARAVQRHSWEKIPDDEKGKGRQWRKATPGGWREDLSSEQAAIVERITEPLLVEFYPPRVADT